MARQTATKVMNPPLYQESGDQAHKMCHDRVCCDDFISAPLSRNTLLCC